MLNCLIYCAVGSGTSEDAFAARPDVRCVQLERTVESFERVWPCVIHPPRRQGAMFSVRRHDVGLQTMLHLQAMLDHAQEEVGIRKLGALLLGDQIAIGKTTQNDQRMWRAQPAVAAAMRN